MRPKPTPRAPKILEPIKTASAPYCAGTILRAPNEDVGRKQIEQADTEMVCWKFFLRVCFLLSYSVNCILAAYGKEYFELSPR